MQNKKKGFHADWKKFSRKYNFYFSDTAVSWELGQGHRH